MISFLDLHKLTEWEELVHDEQAKSEWLDSDDSGSDMDSDDDGSSDSEDEDDDEDEQAMDENWNSKSLLNEALSQSILLRDACTIPLWIK